jgi:hypothetical protein
MASRRFNMTVLTAASSYSYPISKLERPRAATVYRSLSRGFMTILLFLPIKMINLEG